MSRNFFERVLLLVATLLVVASGCRREDPITHVVVDADKSAVQFGRKSTTPQKVAGRMLVGIHQNPDLTWTFKVVGPVADVDAAETQCLDFFRSVEFANGKPLLDGLPEGWKREHVVKSDFSPFARLNIGNDLKMSISNLPTGSFDVLGNVNRWRGQLSLRPAESGGFTKLSGESKVAFEIYDEQGLVSPGGSRPPFAGMGGGGMSPPPTISVEYDAPEGWETSTPNDMVAARFRKEDGELKAQITVVRMPVLPINGWAQVAKNWAGEVGLQSLSAEELDQKAEDKTIDSIDGKMIRLIEDGDDSPMALVGIRLTRGDDVWFIKLKGDKKIVVDSEEVFEKFANSVRFK